MFTENVFTIEEVSQHLRVPEDAIRREIGAGRLLALDVAGFIRVRESDLNAYLNAHLEKDDAKAVLTSAVVENEVKNQNPFPTQPGARLYLHMAGPRRGAKKPTEQYTGVREGVAAYRGKEYRVKMGFTFAIRQESDGGAVCSLIDRYATVEFVAADEKTNGKMAAIVRDRNGKQLPVGATLPPEYQDLPVAPI